ncbi:hypothetical protein WJX74_007940 [Apatococcus lobatus]|uniref:Threonylcarbamoyl-AMP synthase n=1 Tax=Apatococcus lobatus TaxID=904363 RepID=A0AAW1RHH2_9CHLO
MPFATSASPLASPGNLRAREQNTRGALLITSAKGGKRKKASSGGGGGKRSNDCTIVTVEQDGSDLWRLATVTEQLRQGAVGIIPTDTYPALVCDVNAPTSSLETLYAAKDMSPRKPLSILCRGFQDVTTYTLGFPAPSVAGQEDYFRLARRILPGPYTFILAASKQLPKQVTDYDTGKAKSRKTVGVRLPDSEICQAILADLDRPLLCSSAYAETEDTFDLPEAAVIADAYAGRGIDFIVDAGHQVAMGSTIIDMTSAEPVLIRQGKGASEPFVHETVEV